MSNKIGSLLKQKRFAPFFFTQFFGAFNDNVFKNALVILVTFRAADLATQGQEIDSDFLVNLCAGLFILPFFLFSATAGQIADKFEKSHLIRSIKLIEIIVMVMAAIGFYFSNIYFLISVLFIMGAQSTFFGPIKYAILPQHLKEEELIAGNAVVEMGTFVAILLGIIAGSKLIGIEQQGELLVSMTVIAVAAVGYLFSRGIPTAEAADPNLKINWNPITETLNTIRYTRKNMVVFRAIMGISWFWFFGATILTQLPNLTREVLMANDDVFIMLVATFSIGVALGSILCERLSGDVVEIGLVPIGSFFLTLFSIDLYFASVGFVPATSIEDGIGAALFFESVGSIRLIFDVLMIGIFGGFFIVPLYALVQQRSEAKLRSRIIAGNNIFNALFMVASAVMSVALLKLGLSIPELMIVIGVLNLLIAIYVFLLVPEFLMRCLVWCLVKVLYRLKQQGLDNIPKEGAALIICNHVSFVDALVIASSCRRPIRFVMYHKIFATPVLSFIFRTGKAIPIAPKHEDEAVFNQAFVSISEALEAGELVCIFPEGKLTSDGNLGAFKPGAQKILETNPVPVIPMALQGLWGSFFSRVDGVAMKRPFRRIWSRLNLLVGEPVAPELATPEHLADVVLTLRGEKK